MSEDLTPSMTGVLLKLDELSAPGDPLRPNWEGWGGSYGTKGQAVMALTIDIHNPRGCANTLKALKRRQLVENDGGGVYLQNRWRVTEAGHQLAEELRGTDTDEEA